MNKKERRVFRWRRLTTERRGFADGPELVQEDPHSKQKIRSFIDFYEINMNEFEPSDPDAYPVRPALT